MSKITIESNDKNFLVRLIEWLNTQECKLDSTIIKLHDDTKQIVPLYGCGENFSEINNNQII
jgi:hypothetical protein